MEIINKAKKSFQARIIQPHIIKMFDRTRYGQKIERYKDVYKGRRCFFIGNGPSLIVEDLNVLNANGEICFAFNRIYNIFDQTAWRPSFYISQDEKMIMGCRDVVDQLPLSVKFIPIQMRWYYDIDIHDAVYFNMKYQPVENPINELLWSDNPAQNIYCASTGMYTAAQLAVFMGFNEIYLIGVDHHFRVSQNNKGEVIVDKNAKDYFSENYNTDKENLYIPNTEKSTYTYIAMKKYCEERNVNVLNATRGGKLEVFQRIEFENLF